MDWPASAQVSKHYREDFYLVGAIKVTAFKQAVAVSLSQVPCQIYHFRSKAGRMESSPKTRSLGLILDKYTGFPALSYNCVWHLPRLVLCDHYYSCHS